MSTTIFQNWEMVAIYLVVQILFFIFAGFVVINEHEVGIVIKKFSSQKLSAGNFIALNGEAGYQADTLAPGYLLWIVVLEILNSKAPDRHH